ncbi:hypothetical protein OJF2_17860 [Aquisphaera giovannonii]|uniref:Uncharacterized protein n=1 Tax=Aquisphaera giovannonii TaxID=406548 RepID=A0A5B9VZS4_9BACT|nr:hypothetical protein [Aquisphaera giovannonii]QEH33285.1 hypothetical protein OJF2_17860 [Aquisphaera giovannonii]
MPPKRSSSNNAAAGSADRPVINALLILGALGWGVSVLVDRGRLTWPPVALLGGLSTLAGCLALVGPIILSRSGAKDGSLGELVWLTGGLLVWLFDLAGVIQGQTRSINWTTPLGDRAMGLSILAVVLAGWRCGLAARNWSWTNVTGWALGLFWVGMAAASWLLAPPTGLAGLVAR